MAAEVLDHKRGPKVISFKKRRRKNSKRKRGYRDEITVIRVTEILTDGKAPSVKASPKKEKKVEGRAGRQRSESQEGSGQESRAEGRREKDSGESRSQAQVF